MEAVARNFLIKVSRLHFKLNGNNDLTIDILLNQIKKHKLKLYRFIMKTRINFGKFFNNLRIPGFCLPYIYGKSCVAEIYFFIISTTKILYSKILLFCT